MRVLRCWLIQGKEAVQNGQPFFYLVISVLNFLKLHLVGMFSRRRCNRIVIGGVLLYRLTFM